MAFTEDQEKAILEFVTKQAVAPAAPVAPVAPVAPAAAVVVNDFKTKTIAEEAREQIESEKANSSNLNEIQSSIKFNIGISDFVEKNNSLLPAESAIILSKASSKVYASENHKANEIRKELLDSFLSLQENIDSLTVSMASKANDYKALAESDKVKRSSEFWDLAEIGVALKAGIRKAEALNKINGSNVGDDSSNIIESKILAAAKLKFNQNK